MFNLGQQLAELFYSHQEVHMVEVMFKVNVYSIHCLRERYNLGTSFVDECYLKEIHNSLQRV